MVFQSFNLYPHMTALGNVTLALRKVLRKPRAEAERDRARRARSRRAAGQGARLSGRAFRRPAAAGRDRARARARAEGDAVRRADLGARSGARRQRAQRDARAQARRHDHAGGEPRDALCARCRRPRDLHGPRADRGGGPAGADFRRRASRAPAPSSPSLRAETARRWTRHAVPRHLLQVGGDRALPARHREGRGG